MWLVKGKENIMGLEQIKIELVDHAGGDRSVALSARVSFSKEPEQFTDAQNNKLIKYLADHKHLTTMRHNFIQLRCTAPIFLARQLGKHQAGLTWSEESRRYIDAPPEFYMPGEWRARPEGSVKQGSGGAVASNRKWLYEYDFLIQRIEAMYQEMLADDVAPEMARMILPQSMMTTWIWSGNLLAFVHVYKERIASGAQLEAQHFAKELRNVIEPLFPVSFSALIGE